MRPDLAAIATRAKAAAASRIRAQSGATVRDIGVLLAYISELEAERDQWKTAYGLADTPLNDAARFAIEQERDTLKKKLRAVVNYLSKAYNPQEPTEVADAEDLPKVQTPIVPPLQAAQARISPSMEAADVGGFTGFGESDPG